jgi:O-antigen/teichoic acid export membrane protein
MTTLVASGEIENLTYLYKTGTRLFLAVFFPVAIMASVFSEDLLFLWTRNENLATSTAIIASILLLGTALNGVMHFPFALQMAYGLTKLPLLITVTLIVILTPMMIILTLLYGAIGGALAWFSLNISYLFLGTWLTHRKLLKGQALSWLIHSVAIPFGISSAVIVIGWQLTTTKSNHFNNFFWGVFFLFLAILLNFVLMPREFVARLRKWRF